MKIDYTAPYCALASAYASQIRDAEKREIEIENKGKVKPIYESKFRTLDDKVGKRLNFRV